MKYFVIVCLAFVFLPKGESFSDAETAAMMKLHEKCQPISGATDEMAQRAMTGDFPEDAEFKEHMLCMSKGFGFMTDSGEQNMAVIEGQLNKRVSDPALRDEIKSKCLERKETPQETAFQSARCMYAYKDRIDQ